MFCHLSRFTCVDSYVHQQTCKIHFHLERISKADSWRSACLRHKLHNVHPSTYQSGIQRIAGHGSGCSSSPDDVAQPPASTIGSRSGLSRPYEYFCANKLNQSSIGHEWVFQQETHSGDLIMTLHNCTMHMMTRFHSDS